MTRKTDRFIVNPQLLEELLYHDTSLARRMPGKRLKYVDVSLVPEADITVFVRSIMSVPSDMKSHVEPHKHDVSQIYGIIGELTMEVMLDNEWHEVTGPASVFIPAGMIHTVRVVRGSGHVVIILCGKEYR